VKKILLINLATVFITIFFLEILSNYLKLSNLKGIEKGLIDTRNSIHKMIPGSSGIHFGKKIFIDEYGLRVPFKGYSYNEKNRSILIVGDSTTFGNGVSEEETFIGRLRDDFKDLNFYNTAVPGYNIRHFKETLNNFDKFKNIKKVYYFVTLNDLYDGRSIVELDSKKKENSGSKKISLFDRDFIIKVHAFLRNKSYLYMFILGVITDPSKRYFKNIITYYENNNMLEMKEYISSLKNTSSKKNIELKIILLPYEYQTRECTSQNLGPQKKIIGILKNLKIDYSDYTKEFCNYDKPIALFYKFDPMHLSSKGHSFVYDLLKNEI